MINLIKNAPTNIALTARNGNVDEKIALIAGFFFVAMGFFVAVAALLNAPTPAYAIGPMVFSLTILFILIPMAADGNAFFIRYRERHSM